MQYQFKLILSENYWDYYKNNWECYGMYEKQCYYLTIRFPKQNIIQQLHASISFQNECGKLEFKKIYRKIR